VVAVTKEGVVGGGLGEEHLEDLGREGGREGGVVERKGRRKMVRRGLTGLTSSASWKEGGREGVRE